MTEKITERTLYAPIINYLEDLGFKGIQEVSIGKKYPDVVFWYESIKFIIQVKIGKHKKLLEGIVDAYEHATLANTENIIVLLYPPEIRKPLIKTEELKNFALECEIESIILTEYWKNSPKIKAQDLFKELRNKIERKEKEIPSLEFVVGTLRESISSISELLRGYASKGDIKDAINLVVGKFDLFLALGELNTKKKAEKKLQYAAIDLTSYLLVNQILFYHIYSALSKKVPLLTEDIKSIRELEDYFGKIQDINYKSIYSIKVVAELHSDKNIVAFIQKIIKAIKIVKPENIKHDLLGRLFHELLPFKTRKILAAFYTNPIAAELLAGLSIDRWYEKVMDTACGSGTLLVSAYRRKFDLYKQIQKLEPRNIEKMHKKFVEEDLTGSDIMPFASHLTAVNLCAQTIMITTNFLRIAVFDSLDFSKYPNINSGIPVSSFTKTIQATLFKGNKGDLNELKGAVNSNGKGESFKIYPVDTLIMNPPFTDREKMPSDYREKLKKYSKLINKCGGQVNLWGYFLALADDLVKNNGKIGAVIPINIFRGFATEKIRNYILHNYKIRYIVKTTKELGFSEDSAFRDVLLILEKTKPESFDLTGIILLKKSLKEFTIADSKSLIYKILAIPKGESCTDDDMEVYWIDYLELFKYKDNLMPKIGLAQTREVLDGFLNLVKEKGKDKLTKIKRNWLNFGFQVSPRGLSQLVYVTRPITKDRVKRAFLILEEETEEYIIAKIKGTNFKFKIDKSILLHGMRAITGINTIDISEKYDYLITDTFENFEMVFSLSKWNKDKNFNWNMVKNRARKTKTYLAIPERFNPYSKNTSVLAIYSDSKFIPPHTFIIFSIEEELNNLKIISIYLNSVLYFSELMLYKQETTGQFIHIMEKDLVLFNIINPKKLSAKQKQTLLNLFENIRNTEFPSIIEQLETKFWARMELDKTILQILGFTDKEIEEWLSKVYKVLVKELKGIL